MRHKHYRLPLLDIPLENIQALLLELHIPARGGASPGSGVATPAPYPDVDLE
ncbi:MAG: hypothetical protein KKD46_07210 [Euryarchaeota archaeon]|nr:hypothetical protein [Euryarchaeota archaeon]MBU4221822.1 hypothetical protein [Euryarchaeota archaeon]MBU4340688.1 hypothetical protein [Euryarchaeota archaeon]MBU4454342.1 hypothetical protein [Euryarchaeota archaeon]MCG2737334.1 hypothetical protein [Candidatus Methanoperedenaceae archaeon]